MRKTVLTLGTPFPSNFSGAGVCTNLVSHSVENGATPWRGWRAKVASVFARLKRKASCDRQLQGNLSIYPSTKLSLGYRSADAVRETEIYIPSFPRALSCCRVRRSRIPLILFHGHGSEISRNDDDPLEHKRTFRILTWEELVIGVVRWDSVDHLAFSVDQRAFELKGIPFSMSLHRSLLPRRRTEGNFSTPYRATRIANSTIKFIIYLFIQ